MLNSLFELYASKGLSLHELGIKEAVLPIQHAQEALDLLSNDKFLILGGDLYIKLESGEIEPTYENWFYEGINPQDSIKDAKKNLESIKNKDIFVSMIVEIIS